MNIPELETNSMSLPSRISSSFWPADRAQFTPRTETNHFKGLLHGYGCTVVLIALILFIALNCP